MNAHAELAFAVRAGLQQAARGKFAETLGGLVGAGRRTRKTDYHLAVFVGINIYVSVADVEDGLGVAKLEIDAAAADLNIGHRAVMRRSRRSMTIEQRLDVPGTGRHLHHVHAGRVAALSSGETQAGERQVSEE